MKTLPTLIICLATCLVTFAQNAPKVQVVEVDPGTGLVNSEFPFDRSFYIKLKIKKSTEVKYVNLTQTFGLSNSINNDDSTIYDNLGFREEEIKGDDEYKNLMILAPPLSPNKQYELVLTNKYSGSALKNLMKLFYLFDLGLGSEFNSIVDQEKSFVVQEKQLKEFIRKEGDRTDFKIRQDSTIFDLNPTNRYIQLYKKIAEVDPKDCSTLDLDSIERNICEKDTLTLNVTKQYLKLVKEHCGKNLNCEGIFPYNLGTYRRIYVGRLEALYDSLNVIPRIDTLAIQNLSDDDQLEIATTILSEIQMRKKDKGLHQTSLALLANFKSIDRVKLVNIIIGGGQIIGAINQKITEAGDLASRSKNLKINIASFNQLIEDLKGVRPMYRTYENTIADIMLEAISIRNHLEKLKKQIDIIIEHALKPDSHVNDEYIFANTQFEKISSEATRWVLPDIGLLYAFNKNSDVLRPFLGANINFGPVDKDIKTRYITRTIRKDGKIETIRAQGANEIGRFLRQRTSLMLGVSIGTLKVDNEREDLFNSINIITGLGFRVNRAIRLSGGALWYNQINPNPLISDKKTKAMGFLSLSFDIEFKNASGSTFGKIF